MSSASSDQFSAVVVAALDRENSKNNIPYHPMRLLVSLAGTMKLPKEPCEKDRYNKKQLARDVGSHPIAALPVRR
jgi:hypothetical protein